MWCVCMCVRVCGMCVVCVVCVRVCDVCACVWFCVSLVIWGPAFMTELRPHPSAIPHRAAFSLLGADARAAALTLRSDRSGVRAWQPGALLSPRLHFSLPFSIVGAWTPSWSHTARSPGGHVRPRHSHVQRPVLSGSPLLTARNPLQGPPQHFFLPLDETWAL